MSDACADVPHTATIQRLLSNIIEWIVWRTERYRDLTNKVWARVFEFETGSKPHEGGAGVNSVELPTTGVCACDQERKESGDLDRVDKEEGEAMGCSRGRDEGEVCKGVGKWEEQERERAIWSGRLEWR
jgi:hypothetical protein